MTDWRENVSSVSLGERFVAAEYEGVQSPRKWIT